MPSRRYVITYMPVQHINGKLAPSSVKCPNREGGGDNEGFVYGYRYEKIPNINRFAKRVKSRNLTTNPYTNREFNNRMLFRISLRNAHGSLKLTSRRQKIMRDYLKQDKYATLFGYAVARIRANDGKLPAEWR